MLSVLLVTRLTTTTNQTILFQNNPLLVSHDYAKSPLMLEDSNSSFPEEPAVVPEPPVEPAPLDPLTPLSRPLRFAPSHLLALLRSVEKELHACDAVLKVSKKCVVTKAAEGATVVTRYENLEVEGGTAT